MTKRHISLLVIVMFVLIRFPLCLDAEDFKTPGESSRYTQYTQHEEITRFLSHVDHLSKEMVVQVIGQTKETRNYGSKDIYLCIVTEEGADDTSKLNREKPTFLIIASQHGSEQSAKEAALQFIRDLALGKLKPLLEKLNFLIIPQANPYGNFFDQRRNEQDLDLNRDHVKLESPEVRAIHHVFKRWMPEVTMDVHEKGDDYYRVSIGCVSNVNISPRLQEFSRNVILKEVKRHLEERNITFHEYLVTQRMGIDSSAGVNYLPEDQGREETMKRFSTTDLNDGRNSLGIYETLSFIQEGASRHDIETLQERTFWQYHGIRSMAESIARNSEEIMELVHDLRSKLLGKAKTFYEDDVVCLRMEYGRDEGEPTLVIKRFERTTTPIRGILKVDKRAGDPLTMEDYAPSPYPPRFNVIEEVIKNWFPHVEPTVSVPRPVGYIIPAKHSDLVETCLYHGIQVDVYTRDMYLDVEAYQVQDVVPSKYDFLPPEKIDVEKKSLKTIINKEDFYISCAQDGANLIPCLLEPESQYGFIRYWKFKLVPEAGDIFPIYRIVLSKDQPVIPYKRWTR